jgi:hypothetical protein
MINGEIGINISSIKIKNFHDETYEMTLKDINGGFFHICGNNNLKKLLEEALKNIKEVK